MISKKKVNTGFKAKVKSIPAPIGGLNARDSIADMPETDAIILDNWFPSTTDIKTRNGYTTSNISNAGFYVESLMAFNGVSSKKLFSADSNGTIRDVTNSSTGGTPAVTGLTNGRFQYVNMSTPGGNFLLAVNGSDKLRGFDGTAWWRDGDGTHDITGVDTSTLIGINLFKSRVWLTQANSTKAWYLGINSIAGPATAFDVGSLLRLGGFLMGVVTWTINDSSGTQEYISFVSSEGEVLVYQGSDPAFASTFSLAGHFRIGRPIGRRFFCKVGSDIVMLTADGVVMLSKSLLSDRSSIQDAISNKIVNLVNNDVAQYSGNYGWQVILYPIGNKLIINIPQVERSRSYQYVQNTITNSWCTFGYLNPNSSWPSFCYEIFNDNLYFGGFGGVFQCDYGSTDNGNPILSAVKPAFSYFGSKAIQKLFLMIKPYFLASGSVQAAIGINLDFADVSPTSIIPITGSSAASLWNVALWNVSFWSQAGTVTHSWQSVAGVGVAGTTKINISASQPVSLEAIDYMFHAGGYI